MARRTTRLVAEQLRDINLTPLIDLTFLLLITFIITFPLIEQGIPVNLPRGSAAELDQSKSRNITLDGKGQLFLDESPVTPSELAAEMNKLGSEDPDTTVMVRSDEGIAYGKVVAVLKILHDAKISRMALVTNPEPKRGP